MATETVESVRNEIVHLRMAIDRAGCSKDEQLFGEVRDNMTSLMQNTYGDSLFLYIISCTAVPLCFCFAALLLYMSANAIGEKFMRARVARSVSQCAVLQQHLQARTVAQASRRTARRRILFAVALKCAVAAAVLLGLLGSRVAMLAAVRDWLRGLLGGGDGEGEGDGAAGREAYAALMGLLGAEWMADLQSLFIFSSVGSGAMVLGLRLLRSATDDAAALQTGTVSSLQLLQMVDERYRAWGQEEMRRQLEELKALLTGCMGSGEEAEELLCDDEEVQECVLPEAKESSDDKQKSSEDKQNDGAEDSNEDKERTNTRGYKEGEVKEDDENKSNDKNEKNEGTYKEKEVTTKKTNTVDTEGNKEEEVM